LGGWALFLGTPWEEPVYDVARAKTEDDWFYAEFKASQTGILKKELWPLER
jgi:hypothetical protein